MSEHILNSSGRGISENADDLCTDSHVSHHTDRESHVFDFCYVIWDINTGIKTWWKIKKGKKKLHYMDYKGVFTVTTLSIIKSGLILQCTCCCNFTANLITAHELK